MESSTVQENQLGGKIHSLSLTNNNNNLIGVVAVIFFKDLNHFPPRFGVVREQRRPEDHSFFLLFLSSKKLRCKNGLFFLK